jgi:hypothetical protein
MKVQRKHFIKLTFLTCILLLGSCGNKPNSVNSNALAPGASGSALFYTGNPALGSNPAIVTHVQNIKTGVTCLPGRTRLQNDVTFYVAGPFQSGTTIGGNFVAGILPGDNSELHVGVSAFRDLMFVTKVTSGSQVLGFNVTMSFCDVANPYPNFPLLVSNDRPLVNFRAPQGIILDMNTYCGYGVIDAALNTAMTSQQSMSNQLTAPFTFPTSFTKPICNGQF